MVDSKTIDVVRVIDESPLSGFQLFVIAICFLVSMLDGFDTQAIAFAAPSIAAEWKLAPSLFGPIFSAGLLGTVVGAMGMGLFQDRIGRRTALIISVLAFSLLTILTAFATSFESLVAVRFLAGIGLGAALPNFLAYASEFSPARTRARAVTVTVWGFPFGAVVGGLIAAPYVRQYGWQPIFWFGGLVPLLLVPVVWFGLPETIRFLTLKPNNAPQIAAILRRINPSLQIDPDSTFVLNEPRVTGASFPALFKRAFLAGSILLPLALFASLLLTFCLLNWIPILLRQAGLGPENALYGVVTFNLAGIIGSLFLTRFIDKGGRPLLIMGGAYVIGAVAVASIGVVGTAFWQIMAIIFMAGVFIIGPQLSLTAFIANFYPTAMRGTGIGWVQSVGRVGSLIGPLVGGALIALGTAPATLFQIISLSALVTATALLVMMYGVKSTAATAGVAAE
jgi:AAHS family 4-hydroxybenzoate transporter-like MFS transporter